SARGGTSLSRRETESTLKTLDVSGPDFRIDQPRWPLAVERVEHLLGGNPRHIFPRLPGDARGMGACDHIVEGKQGMIGRRRLLGPDVEASARDALVAQRLLERHLVVDEAARSGDEIGMRLHQREFARAD